jgi:hypothetical protein
MADDEDVLRSAVLSRGFALWARALGRGDVERLIEASSPAAGLSGVRARRGQPFAIRHLLWQRPGFAGLLAAVGLDAVATRILGGAVRPVDAILFDKIPAANWRVASHQDLVVPVERADDTLGPVARYGVTYVEAPARLLARLLILRVHLDDAPAGNGALAVVPGSHASGILSDAALDELGGRFEPCEARAGDVLLMKPLLVHRSPASRAPAHRRVLQILYAPDEDPGSIAWKVPRP